MFQWVQRNIYALGGDPSQVTLFGQGGGGWSVHYQLMSDQAQGLFQAAIIQSGSVLSSALESYRPQTLLESHRSDYLKRTGCNYCNDDDDQSHSDYECLWFATRCLRSKTPEELMRGAFFTVYDFRLFFLGPTFQHIYTTKYI